MGPENDFRQFRINVKECFKIAFFEKDIPARWYLRPFVFLAGVCLAFIMWVFLDK